MLQGSGINGAGLTKNTTGTLTLAGTNAYTGNTVVSNGTLKFGGASPIPTGAAAGNVVLDGGATAGILDLGGFSGTINGLSGITGAVLGQVFNSTPSTTSILSVGNNNTTSSFVGVVKDNGGAGGIVGLSKIGNGTLSFGGATANTFTGITTILSGTLALGKTAGVSALGGDLQIGDGSTAGTVRLLASDQIPDGSAVSLQAGATFDANGLSESAGALTLGAGTSTLDFGAGSSAIVSFSSAATWNASAILNIVNWTGIAELGGGSERLHIGATASSLTAGQLTQIHFVDPAAPDGFYPATILGNGEVVPVPEPAAGALFALPLVGLLARRRRMKR